MREILFRGKRTDNDEWVCGSVLQLNIGRTFICDGAVWIGTLTPCKLEVDPETVGQYTGLKDEHGEKIFEGDIVRVHDYLVKRGDPCHEFEGVVGHQNASFMIISDVVKHYRWIDYECEIIGNIHDNPELLEVES